MTPDELQSTAARVGRRLSRQPAGCWTWPGARQSSGYGLIRPTGGGNPVLTHRVVYLATVGDLGDLVVDHLCRNRLCARPSHLEAVTVWENTRRGQLLPKLSERMRIEAREYAAQRQVWSELLDDQAYGYATERADLLSRGTVQPFPSFVRWRAGMAS